jgi:MFS family permease
MIFTSTALEIPTGAIADLLGKRNTLIASFVFRSAGNILMGLATSFSQIGFSVFIMTIGGALYSGTMESLVYDSLKEKGQESRFDKIVAHTTSIQLIATAIASIAGGLLYMKSVQLPFFALAACQIIALVLCVMLTEPKVDSYRFSFKRYKNQLASGFSQLFSVQAVKKRLLFILMLGALFVVSYEVVSDIVLVEFGYNAKEIGILISIMYIVGAISSQITPYLSRRFGLMPSILGTSIVGATTYVVTPILNKFSVRWLYGDVERSTQATVTAYDEHGESFVRGASGLLAQIFQHEIDHLDGILFIDKAHNLEEVTPEKNHEY